jgi:PadR family transcriptional regulator, regulatory protein PadR
MAADKSEVLQGTLDLMILKTLQALGPLHGFGIARRIEQLSEDVLTLNEGTVYTSLLRLQQKSWIASEWGVSENNRRARFYSITKRGLKQLAVETENWERIAAVIGRVLALGKGLAMSDRALTFVAKLKALFGQRTADSAFEEEMSTHLEMLAEKYEREGMSAKKRHGRRGDSLAIRLC